MSGTDPVRWWVFDDWLPPPAEPVPPADWPGWEARYENPCESGKRTTRRPDEVYRRDNPFGLLTSPSVAAEWSARLGYPVEHDPTMHGGGLHVTAPGGRLGIHLDYDRHPVLTAKRRALNLILFLHPRWEPDWGGALLLCDPMGVVVTRIEPLPGRLVAFEVGDLSYHGVGEVTGPAERVSGAAYLLSDAGPRHTRRRAMFLPPR